MKREDLITLLDNFDIYYEFSDNIYIYAAVDSIRIKIQKALGKYNKEELLSLEKELNDKGLKCLHRYFSHNK